MKIAAQDSKVTKASFLFLPLTFMTVQSHGHIDSLSMNCPSPLRASALCCSTMFERDRTAAMQNVGKDGLPHCKGDHIWALPDDHGQLQLQSSRFEVEVATRLQSSDDGNFFSERSFSPNDHGTSPYRTLSTM